MWRLTAGGWPHSPTTYRRHWRVQEEVSASGGEEAAEKGNGVRSTQDRFGLDPRRTFQEVESDRKPGKFFSFLRWERNIGKSVLLQPPHHSVFILF